MPELIKIRDARKIAISRQFPSLRSSKERVASLIESLGYVQIDTISIVERAHNHILWNRLPSYKRHHFDEEFEKGKKIFEYWHHAASFLPMRDYRYSLIRKDSYRKKYSQWRKANKKLVSHILERIAAEGPLTSNDFEGRKDGPSGWWNFKPAKLALEILFFSGDLMVASRRNFNKHYDLTEKVLPDDTNDKYPSKTEFYKYLIMGTINAHGLATDKEILHLQTKSQKDYSKALNELIEEGKILSVNVEGCGKETYRTSEDMLNSNAIKSRNKIRILSPFDNSVIKRYRLKKIFDFEYTLECYVPKHKRRYGYFCLPVLNGFEFEGFIDCKAMKADSVFEVISLHPRRRSRREFMELIEKDVRELAGFTSCNEVKWKGNLK